MVLVAAPHKLICIGLLLTVSVQPIAIAGEWSLWDGKEKLSAYEMPQSVVDGRSRSWINFPYHSGWPTRSEAVLTADTDQLTGTQKTVLPGPVRRRVV
jgi:hypothetical protein